jgi:actin-related protein 4
VKSSPLGGNFVTDQIRMMFKAQPSPVPLVPHYMISAKTAVPAGEPSQAIYKRFDIPPTDSFRLWQEERVLTDFKQSVVEVWPGPGKLSGVSPQGLSNEELAARGSPGKPFEMPDGWNQVFGVERNKVTEGLFDAQAAYTVRPPPLPRTLLTWNRTRTTLRRSPSTSYRS